jgi:nickel-dependent lactate racemase
MSEHAGFNFEGRHLELSYGKGFLAADLPETGVEIRVLLPPRPPLAAETRIVAQSALDNPLDKPPLRKLVKPGEKIVVLISDITRPCPTSQLLPLVMEELRLAGAKDQDIQIVSGLGIHRKQTDAERERLVGREIFQRFGCLDHDPDEVSYIGNTSRGTPVEIFTPVVKADRRICIGAIEYHYFAGFSGGYKGLVPSVASQRTVESNHGWMVKPGAESGCLEGNPVRADIDEAGSLVGLDFILNVILDDEQRVVAAVAGDPLTAHRAGCAKLTGFGRPHLPWYADVVIASAGGFPKDINLYQAQKALDNARLAVREGGTIILTAECPEGLGESKFQDWMLSGQSADQLIERIHSKFVLGGHKAAAIALVRKRADISLVSAFSARQASVMGFQPFVSIQQALDTALGRFPRPVRIAIMPLGGSVLPQVRLMTAAISQDLDV